MRRGKLCPQSAAVLVLREVSGQPLYFFQGEAGKICYIRMRHIFPQGVPSDFLPTLLPTFLPTFVPGIAKPGIHIHAGLFPGVSQGPAAFITAQILNDPTRLFDGRTCLRYTHEVLLRLCVEKAHPVA